MTTPDQPLSPAGAIAVLRTTIRRRVIGQDTAIDELLAALLARGHVLLEGVPGVAKTIWCGWWLVPVAFASDAFSSPPT